ncbi:hypothetical protein MRX96_029091 [Rhipicephalus microplus]
MSQTTASKNPERRKTLAPYQRPPLPSTQAPKRGDDTRILVLMATWTSRVAMNPALRNPPATPGICRTVQARNKKGQLRRRVPRMTSLHSLVLTRLVSRNFHPPTALPPNPEEVPIVSCGRYVLPDTDHLSTDQCTSIEMQTAGAAPTNRCERSRSRSP